MDSDELVRRLAELGKEWLPEGPRAAFDLLPPSDAPADGRWREQPGAVAWFNAQLQFLDWWRRGLALPYHALHWASDYLNRAANLDDPDDYIRFAVRVALHNASPSDLNDTGEARDRLGRAVLEALPGLVEAINEAHKEVREEDLLTGTVETPAGPVPWMTEVFARFLEGTGEAGHERAGATRKEEAQTPEPEPLPTDLPPPVVCPLWRLWLPRGDMRLFTGGPDGLFFVDRNSPVRGVQNGSGAPPFLARLAYALWLDQVRPKMEEEAARRSRQLPALAMPLFRDLVSLGSRAKLATPDMRAARGVALLHADTAQVIRDARAGLPLFGSLTFQRFLRWLVGTVAIRTADGEADPAMWTVDGGWKGLAEELGYDSPGDRADLRKIVLTLAHIPFRFPDGSTGNLLAYRDFPAAPGRRSRVTLTVPPPLRPSYVFQLHGDDKTLVPFPVKLPPLVGRPRDHGAQADLHLWAMAELRRLAPDVYRHGGGEITLARWEEGAADTGLPVGSLSPVLDRWKEGEDAVLVEVDRGRYAPADPEILAFIKRSGEKEVQGAEGGRRGRKKKRY